MCLTPHILILRKTKEMTNQDKKELVDILLESIRSEAHASIDSEEGDMGSPVQILIDAQLRLSNSSEDDHDIPELELFEDWKKEIMDLLEVLKEPAAKIKK